MKLSQPRHGTGYKQELDDTRKAISTLRAENAELQQYQLDCKCADFAVENDAIRAERDELRERCEALEVQRGEMWEVLYTTSTLANEHVSAESAALEELAECKERVAELEKNLAHEGGLC